MIRKLTFALFVSGALVIPTAAQASCVNGQCEVPSGPPPVIPQSTQVPINVNPSLTNTSSPTAAATSSPFSSQTNIQNNTNFTNFATFGGGVSCAFPSLVVGSGVGFQDSYGWNNSSAYSAYIGLNIPLGGGNSTACNLGKEKLRQAKIDTVVAVGKMCLQYRQEGTLNWYVTKFPDLFGQCKDFPENPVAVAQPASTASPLPRPQEPVNRRNPDYPRNVLY